MNPLILALIEIVLAFAFVKLYMKPRLDKQTAEECQARRDRGEL